MSNTSERVCRWIARLVFPIWPGLEIGRLERKGKSLHERMDAIEASVITTDNPLRWFFDGVQADGSQVRLTMRNGAVYEGSVIDEGLIEPTFVVIATPSAVLSLRVADVARFEELTA